MNLVGGGRPAHDARRAHPGAISNWFSLFNDGFASVFATDVGLFCEWFGSILRVIWVYFDEQEDPHSPDASNIRGTMAFGAVAICIQIDEFCIQNDGFYPKTWWNISLKSMNFAFKTMDFTLKTDDLFHFKWWILYFKKVWFCIENDDCNANVQEYDEHNMAVTFLNDEFCIKNDGCCIKNDGKMIVDHWIYFMI